MQFIYLPCSSSIYHAVHLSTMQFIYLQCSSSIYHAVHLSTVQFIYLPCSSSSTMLVHQVASIESCTQRVHNWLLNNGLHLNPSKSEAIAFFNPRSKPLEALAESIKSISVAGSPIKLQSSIKNLGVHLDSRMSFDKQVSETCKASYFHIRALRHIQSSLTTEACKTVAAAIVGSRLDYCNSLLAGTSVSNLARLQLVQNTLAR